MVRRHQVREHKRGKDSVRSYTRGSGVGTTRRSRVVSSSNRLSMLKGELYGKEWGIDTEYCHGGEGMISFAPLWSGRGIGPDMAYTGTLAELMAQTKPGGKIYNYLKANGYTTKIDTLEASSLEPEDKEYLTEYGIVHKLEVYAHGEGE